MDEVCSCKSSARPSALRSASYSRSGSTASSRSSPCSPSSAGAAWAPLFTAISAWTATRGLNEIEVPVLDNNPASLAFAQRRGFVEERREVGVVLHLAEIAPPPVEPPDGVEIVTWAERPELARGMYEVALEALADIPGQESDEAEPFEDWLAHDMQSSGDKPEATFLAVAGDDVVGIARALKAAEINWAIENSYEELHTRNEQRNEPIRRLNERFGYRTGIGRIYLVGPLA
jgi:hypothetical protein